MQECSELPKKQLSQDGAKCSSTYKQSQTFSAMLKWLSAMLEGLTDLNYFSLENYHFDGWTDEPNLHKIHILFNTQDKET